VLRLLIFAIVTNYYRNCCKKAAGGSQNTFGLSDPVKILLSEQRFPHPGDISLRGINHGEYNSFLLPMQEEFLEFNGAAAPPARSVRPRPAAEACLAR